MFTVINGHSVDIVESEFRRRFHVEVAHVIDEIHAMNLIESVGGHVPFRRRQSVEMTLKHLLSIGSYPDDKLQASLKHPTTVTSQPTMRFMVGVVSRLFGDVGDDSR
jgi:hypothetical protein